MLPKIGFRNLKTAIAVFICLLVIKVINIGSPFFACIAAVITMQNTVDNSFKAGLERMVGTVIGAAIGIVMAMISPLHLLLSAIGIVLVIYLTNLFKQKNSTSIACIVFLAVMTNLTDVTPLHYASMRILETFLGIIVAVLVNYFVFPQRALNSTVNNDNPKEPPRD